MPKPSKEKARVYFPGLHGLRFVAAMMVVFSHVELMKDYHGHPNLYAGHLAVYESGRMGVTLFFVSERLPHFISAADREESLWNRCGQEILRAPDPSHLATLLPRDRLVTFALLPQFGFFTVPKYTELMPAHIAYTLPLYILLLPQVALSIFEPVPFAEPLWSIGVEEQFYLLWPVLMKHVKKFLRLTLFIIIGAVALKQIVFMLAAAARNHESLRYWNYFLNYLYFTRIECMAVGGVGAWLVFARRDKVLKVIYHRGFQVALYAITLLLLCTQTFKPVYNYLVYAVCFCLIIMNVAANRRSLIKIREPSIRAPGEYFVQHLYVPRNRHQGHDGGHDAQWRRGFR